MTERILPWAVPAGDVRGGRRALAAITVCYIVAIAVAEATTVFLSGSAGILSHAILVLVLLTHAGLAAVAPYRRLLLALALVPMLRILSLTMPIRYLPEVYWYALVGVPLLLAIMLAARLAGRPKERLRLSPGAWPAQLLVAASGAPLSLIAFWLLPRAPVPAGGWVESALGVVVLLICSGLAEELLFRGLLQSAAREVFGRADVLFSTILFTIVYIGTLSAGYILFVALAGLFFGWCTRRTNSIWGVALAHGLTSVGVVYLWPYIFR